MEQTTFFIFMMVATPQKMMTLKEPWYSGSNLFAAGLFCLVLGVFLGNKFLAAGQLLGFLGIAVTLILQRGDVFHGGHWNTSAKCLAVFVLISIASVLGNISLIESPALSVFKVRPFVLILFVLAMPMMVSDKIMIPWRRDILVLAWLIPMVLAIVVSIVGWATGFRIHEGDHATLSRFSGFYGQVMTFANCLQFSVIILTIALFSRGVWESMTRLPRWLLVGTWLIAVGGLFFTFTRGAMLAALAGILLSGAMKSKRTLISIVLLSLIISVAAYFGGTRYFQKRYDPRMNHWRAAALAAVERPMLGWGFRNFEAHSVEIKERYDFPKDYSWIKGVRQAPSHLRAHAHNMFLETFATTGFLGGIAFLAFCFYWFREVKGSYYRTILLPPMVAFLVSGLFENTFFDSETLNTILLIYLISQWVLSHEKEGAAGGSSGDRVWR